MWVVKLELGKKLKQDPALVINPFQSATLLPKGNFLEA